MRASPPRITALYMRLPLSLPHGTHLCFDIFVSDIIRRPHGGDLGSGYNLRITKREAVATANRLIRRRSNVYAIRSAERSPQAPTDLQDTRAAYTLHETKRKVSSLYEDPVTQISSTLRYWLSRLHLATPDGGFENVCLTPEELATRALNSPDRGYFEVMPRGVAGHDLLRRGDNSP